MMGVSTQRNESELIEGEPKHPYKRADYPASFTKLLGVGEEEYCRYLWSKKVDREKFPAWQAMGNRQSGKPVTSLLDFKMKSEGYIPSKEQVHCGVDVFCSPNQFFDWRNTKQLAQLHANWLEIDTVGHEILTLEQQELIFAEVYGIIKLKGLPTPTGYVYSGSGGLHLYWIYNGMPAFKWAVRVWREITLCLARTVKRERHDQALWVVDFAASRDPARVLRLPGTFHGKSGRIAEAYLGGPIYSFHSLASLLITSPQNRSALQAFQTRKTVPIQRKPRISKPLLPQPEVTDSITSGRHTIGQWWFRTYTVICKHARIKGVKEGQRDHYAFLLFVALKHIKKSTDEALKTIKDINKEFIHLEEHELLSYLQSAISKNYKYSKDTLAEYLESNLGISSDYLFQSDTSPLPPEEVKKLQVKSASDTAKKKRSNTLTALKLAIKTLLETRVKVTQVSLAALANRSVRTVRRYWKELLSDGTLGLSLYIPPPGEMTG